jgi:2-polyprenyl-6-methoxyphenol hydroxylase-like FAD-dependent oxidoreductase
MFAKKDPQVLVVGAGPVGLLAALVLAKRGVRVQIVDRDWRTGAHSYALALHGQALKLLSGFGVFQDILQRASRVHSVGVYAGAERKAEFCLSNDGDDLSALVVLPQDVLERLLENALHDLGVDVLWNHEVTRLIPHDDRVDVTIDTMEKASTGYAVARQEWTVAKSTQLSVPLLIGADGLRSFVRRTLGIDFMRAGPSQQYAVFETRTDVNLKPEMRLMLGEHTTDAVWPLPEKYCRWSFELLAPPAPPGPRVKDRLSMQLGGADFASLSEDNLHQLIAERAPWFAGHVEEITWRLVVPFERRLANRFGCGRVWLAGDAAHTTAPAGMQSMNVGLSEADQLADLMAGVLEDGQDLARLEAYNRERSAQWRQLLGLEGSLRPGRDTDPWIAEHFDRLLPCLPASGYDLQRLAQQVGAVAGAS